MRNLAARLARWVIRYCLSFALIVAVLVFGTLAWHKYGEIRRDEAELNRFKSAEQSFDSHLRLMRAEVTGRVEKLEKAPLNALNARIEAIDSEVRQKSSEQPAFIGQIPFAPGFIERLERDIKINLLKQERKYLADLRSSLEFLQKGPPQLEVLKKERAAVQLRVAENELAQVRVGFEHPITSKFYGLPAYRELKELKEAGRVLLQRSQNVNEDHERLRMLLEAAKNFKPNFKIEEDQFTHMLLPLKGAIQELEDRKVKSWLWKAQGLVLEQLWPAFFILISLALIPFAIKPFFYFVLAPLASRRPPICLLPRASGAILEASVSPDYGPDPAMVSAVSRTIAIGHRDELLVKPEYLQSSSASGAKDTRWLLDWAHPVTSLASGMYALTRIRTQAGESIVISATGNDQWTEVGVLTLPEGASLMLHPRHLIGVAYRSDVPLKVTSHWRLASLQAWLTLQLRFLVFHGPARLVVRGSRGIRVEKALGRRIRQAATIGFSANVRYSTMRCEPFVPYLLGKQELLDDCFAGESGFFVYEESPGPGSESGKAGRGLEGFADSFLKIFGI